MNGDFACPLPVSSQALRNRIRPDVFRQPNSKPFTKTCQGSGSNGCPGFGALDDREHRRRKSQRMLGAVNFPAQTPV